MAEEDADPGGGGIEEGDEQRLHDAAHVPPGHGVDQPALAQGLQRARRQGVQVVQQFQQADVEASRRTQLLSADTSRLNRLVIVLFSKLFWRNVTTYNLLRKRKKG